MCKRIKWSLHTRIPIDISRRTANYASSSNIRSPRQPKERTEKVRLLEFWSTDTGTPHNQSFLNIHRMATIVLLIGYVYNKCNFT